MTGTTAFGTGKREGHDAAAFYARFTDPVLSIDNTVHEMDDTMLDQIWCADAQNIREYVGSRTVGLVFTSPPYHVGKDYDTDVPFDEYLAMLRAVFDQCFDVLEPGGKLVVNLANLGRKPYIFLTDIVSTMLTEIGFLARGEIIWVKGEGSNGSCAWGTYMSARNPVVRDLHEYLLVFSKGAWGRVRAGVSTISDVDFMRDTLSVWKVRPESAKRVSHPAPFPVELAERVINLFSYEGDVVLDPFLGSGTTAIAAEHLGRRWIGFETDVRYALLADQRIRAARMHLPQPDTDQKETS